MQSDTRCYHKLILRACSAARLTRKAAPSVGQTTSTSSFST
jgi:hypothetical protein